MLQQSRIGRCVHLFCTLLTISILYCICWTTVSLVMNKVISYLLSYLSRIPCICLQWEDVKLFYLNQSAAWCEHSRRLKGWFVWRFLVLIDSCLILSNYQCGENQTIKLQASKWPFRNHTDPTHCIHELKIVWYWIFDGVSTASVVSSSGEIYLCSFFTFNSLFFFTLKGIQY